MPHFTRLTQFGVQLFVTVLVLCSNYHESETVATTSCPGATGDNSYFCQHKALNEEVLAAGNDLVKLGEIQWKLTKLRELEREQVEQDERRRREEFERRAREREEERWAEEEARRSSHSSGGSRPESGDQDPGQYEGDDFVDPDERTWFFVIACVGGVVVIGCLISIISAGRHTGTSAARSYEIDEPIVIGESLLTHPHSHHEGFIRHAPNAAPLLVVVMDDRTDDDFRTSSASSEPPPDYEEAMRTSSRQPQSYNNQSG